MIKKQFPAFTGTEKRRVYIYLPNEYKFRTDKKYPVLYMFDGHNVFFNKDATYGKSWGLGKYLRNNRIPLIVVAVDCHHGAGGERVSEYSPYDFVFDDKGDGIGTPGMLCHGYGRQTMDWFVNELKPEIDRDYRTLPDRDNTFIMGSSMGGLMSLFALVAYNDVFSKACALSPALDLWYEPVLEELEQAGSLEESELYMDYGMFEDDFAECYDVLTAINMMLSERGVSVTFRTVPNGTHSEGSWEKQLPFAIGTLMYKK